MIKRLSIVTLVIVLLFALSYNFHAFLVTQNVSFSLFGVYLFFAVSTIIIYSVVELVYNTLPNQAAYVYLALMFTKIGVFVLVFREDIFSNVNLSQLERMSLIVPLFLFLIAEALAIVKLLNNK
jgi:hypothetical protein